MPIHDVTDPQEIGRYVYQAKNAVQAADPEALLDAVGVLLQHDNWKRWVDPYSGDEYTWRDFRKFVEERLSTTVERLIGALSAAPGLRQEIEDLASVGRGGDRRSEDFKQNNVPFEKATGNNASKDMRRLGRDRPDLAARVDDGELTVNAAMIQAKFRHPTVSVPVNRPDSAARTLRKRMTPDDLARLVELLQLKNETEST
jgi:hypothetical protein